MLRENQEKFTEQVFLVCSDCVHVIHTKQVRCSVETRNHLHMWVLALLKTELIHEGINTYGWLVESCRRVVHVFGDVEFTESTVDQSTEVRNDQHLVVWNEERCSSKINGTVRIQRFILEGILHNLDRAMTGVQELRDHVDVTTLDVVVLNHFGYFLRLKHQRQLLRIHHVLFYNVLDD